MIIFVVIYVYVMYNVSTHYSWNDFKEVKEKVSGEGEVTEEVIKFILS